MDRKERKQLLENCTYHAHFKYKNGHVTMMAVDDNETNLTYIGVAFCSPKDQFCKKTGRLLALKRLSEGIRDNDKEMNVYLEGFLMAETSPGNKTQRLYKALQDLLEGTVFHTDIVIPHWMRT